MGLLQMKPDDQATGAPPGAQGVQPGDEPEAMDSPQEETGEGDSSQGDVEGEQPNVSPEEQKIYDTMMQKAGDIIYGDGKVMPEILQALKPASEPAQDPNGGNPAVLALANTATQVIQKLDVASTQAGQQIPDDVLYHGGVEIIEMLAEVAEHAGYHDYSEDELNGALFQTVDNYRPIAEEMGRTTDETLKGQFQEVQDADAQGKLGDLLPGAGPQTVGEAPVKPDA